MSFALALFATACRNETGPSGTAALDAGTEPDCGSGPDGGTDAETVSIPAGPFWMGCNDAVDVECYGDERPYHEVTLSEYAVDRTEVTVEAYGACVQAGTCSSPDTGESCNWNVMGHEKHPVNCVSWLDAQNYCAWAGKTLPTEAEWEKAARGSDGRRYPWGNATLTCARANYLAPCVRATEAVGNHPCGASPYGALDMGGNVWEWVADWFDPSYYSYSPSNDPPGSPSGSTRGTRGGSWDDGSRWVAASARDWADPSLRSSAYGFRCASHP
jgi:eukaryotic-like serine/threonine-protein kinase